VDARTAIRHKRDGGRHTPEEVQALADAYAKGEVPDYQMAAWLMAVFYQGLDRDETMALTRAMLHSGTVIEFEDLPGPTVDKHSTGGVGDKISLPLAPIVAACGAYVPMLSGRGLGHTGGTLDKLESIPGFRTRLSIDEFKRQVRALGLAFGGQTADLAPADGKLYALRDVTATVECVPLIVSSILSKKFASGTRRVVFDVKTGRGAFMRRHERAHELGRALLEVTGALGFEGVALVTDMDQPLGRAAGNALEVVESIEVLRGGGPEDVRALTLRLAGEMLALAGLAPSVAAGEALAGGALADGRALAKFRAVVEAQGGDPRAIDDPGRLPRAPRVVDVPAPRAGHVAVLDAYAVGEIVVRLGGGRLRKEDGVDPGVGVELLKKVGDRVEAGEPLARIHARDSAEAASSDLVESYRIEDRPTRPGPLVLERIPPAR
jgi:pyrimidine-nucleoside phosphorylase/thymidine phosphorylase